MTERNNADVGFKKILAKAFNAFTQESGEEPTMMINVGDGLCEGVLCHSTVVKSKAPHLYYLVQMIKRRGTLTSAPQSESLQGEFYRGATDHL